MIKLNKLSYSVKQAAEVSGMHPDTIRYYLRSGILQGDKFGQHGNWRIPKSEIERLLGKSSESNEATKDKKEQKLKGVRKEHEAGLVNLKAKEIHWQDIEDLLIRWKKVLKGKPSSEYIWRQYWSVELHGLFPHVLQHCPSTNTIYQSILSVRKLLGKLSFEMEKEVEQALSRAQDTQALKDKPISNKQLKIIIADQLIRRRVGLALDFHPFKEDAKGKYYIGGIPLEKVFIRGNEETVERYKQFCQDHFFDSSSPDSLLSKIQINWKNLAQASSSGIAEAINTSLETHEYRFNTCDLCR